MNILDYKIKRLIGQGSYGKVYLGYKDKDDHHLYALKKINLLDLDQYCKKNLVNEIKILSCVNCCYLINNKDIFTYQNNIYLVSDYAVKGDLSNIIKNHQNYKTKFAENTIWKYFIQIIFGLKYLHSNDIIHRDIKSNNIFVDKNDNIKIGDFGISKILTNYLNYAQTIIGTPYYLAPEILKRIRYNSKVDIWSLGVILYELITLSVPFKGNNMNELKNNILSGYYNKQLLSYNYELKIILVSLLRNSIYVRPSVDDLLKNYIIQNKMVDLKLVEPNYKLIGSNWKVSYVIPKKTDDWDRLVDLFKPNIEENNKVSLIRSIKSSKLPTKKQLIRKTSPSNQIISEKVSEKPTKNEISKPLIHNPEDLKENRDNVDYEKLVFNLNLEIKDLRKRLLFKIFKMNLFEYKLSKNNIKGNDLGNIENNKFDHKKDNKLDNINNNILDNIFPEYQNKPIFNHQLPEYKIKPSFNKQIPDYDFRFNKFNINKDYDNYEFNNYGINKQEIIQIPKKDFSRFPDIKPYSKPRYL